MNKEEFLNTLRKRLSVLEDSEIEDIINEYEGYIEEKVNVGLTEEEAVKELGNIDEIVHDLLSCYKVKDQNVSVIDKMVNKVGDFIDRFMDSLNDKSAKDIFKILIEVMLVLFIVSLLKFPFNIVKDLGTNIFEELTNPLDIVFISLWRFIIELSYVILAVIFTYKVFEKRLFKDISNKIVDEDFYIDKDSKTNKKSSKKTTNQKKESPKTTPYIKEEVEYKEYSENPITKFLIYVIKFFCLLLLMANISYLVGISIAFGTMLYMIVKGVAYYGILVLIIALFLGGTFTLELLINFIFNRKNKPISIFSKIIMLIITLGVGLTLSAIEISDTSIIYDASYPDVKTISKEIPIPSNLKIYNYDEIKLDDTLKDTIKIVYTYPDIDNNLKISIDLEDCGDALCLDDVVNNFTFNKHVLDKLITTLKDKKIYIYDFKIKKTIYANSNFIKLIKENNNEEPKIPTSTFSKNFYINNITSFNEYYNQVILRLIHTNDLKTIKLPKNISSSLISNKTYEFTFEANEYISSDLETLFQKCKVIAIKEV